MKRCTAIFNYKKNVDRRRVKGAIKMGNENGPVQIVLLMSSIFLLSLVTISIVGQETDYGNIEHVGSMLQPRFNHTATTLQSGKVLVTGGTETGYDSLNSPEIFNPESRKFNSIEPMKDRRMRHTSTLLPSGKVLIAGGYQGNGYGHPSGFYSFNGPGNVSLDRCEVFDPATETFSMASPMRTGRFWQRAVLMNDGRVLVIGGVNATHNGLTSCEFYDPVADSWEYAGELNEPRARFSATLMTNGSVIITGGHNGTFKEPISSCEIYVPSRDKWFTIAPMNNARGFHGAVELFDGRLMVSGGFAGPEVSDQSSSEIYDPITNTWVLTGSLNTPRHSHFMVPVGTKGMIAYGGSSCTEFYCTVSGLEYYDIEREDWIDTYIIVLGRKWPAEAFLSDGSVLICGGQTCTEAEAAADIYHLPGDDHSDDDPKISSTNLLITGLVIFVLLIIVIRIMLSLYLRKRHK